MIAANSEGEWNEDGASLDFTGLVEVLRGYCDTFSHSRAIPVSCDVDESIAELSPGTALALYRIAQEALGNAARHAAPARVDVRALVPAATSC